MDEDEQHIADTLGAGGLTRSVTEGGGRTPKPRMGTRKSGLDQSGDCNQAKENAAPIACDAERIADGDDCERADVTKAQNRPAKSALLEYGLPITMVIFTAGIFIATAVYAWISNGQLAAIQKQADIAAADLRPWLKIKSINLRAGHGPIKTLLFHNLLTGKQSPPFIQLNISVENVGRSVAQDIDVHPDFFWAPFTSDRWYDTVTAEQSRFCDSVRTAGAIPGNGIAFPSDSYVWNGGAGALPPTPDSAAAVIICVNYRGAPGTRYQSQAWSGLYENGQAVVPVGADADISVLKLYRQPGGDHEN